jgi:large subunit ribosomal protein L20
MPRSVNAVASRRRRKRIMNLAKGYWGSRSKVYTVAKNTVEKGLQYAYRDRKTKKREFRALWIQRINAGAREHGLTYARFMNGLKRAGIELDRKQLSDLAITEPATFKALVEKAQGALKA